MKKFLIVCSFVSFIAVVMTSCKKDYVCNCLITWDGPPVRQINTLDPMHGRKSELETTCENQSSSESGMVKTCKLRASN